MTTDPLRRWDGDDAGDVDASADDHEPALPPTPRLRRCGCIRDVGAGPWIGTLACCTRPAGHDGDHAMTLGDSGSTSFWQETWS